MGSSKHAGGGKYTTQEQIIGEWIDGKPIYEKVIIFSVASYGEQLNYSHNIANIDKPLYAYGRVTNTDGTLCGLLPTAYTDSLTPINFMMYIAEFNRNFITYCVGNQRTSYTKIEVICRYTKTTDATN